ncbi:hypothetical protein GHT07_07395 [Caenimonas koreensis DSM 17982]|uniref:Uncharacterized protein n=1 Tax=Caenimonas koreensis DSM 17982 TaxID=1121255 RepID=A0A844AXH9_9BURK|nr:hypothetical protein [Caenimonas koreensis DSM 17982]
MLHWQRRHTSLDVDDAVIREVDGIGFECVPHVGADISEIFRILQACSAGGWWRRRTGEIGQGVERPVQLGQVVVQPPLRQNLGRGQKGRDNSSKLQHLLMADAFFQWVLLGCAFRLRFQCRAKGDVFTSPRPGNFGGVSAGANGDIDALGNVGEGGQRKEEIWLRCVLTEAQRPPRVLRPVRVELLACRGSRRHKADKFENNVARTQHGEGLLQLSDLHIVQSP